MKYTIPFLCPILSPRICIASYICPCYISSIIYARLFKNKQFSCFGLFMIPFSAYGIRRFVVQQLNYEEDAEVSAYKSCCFCNSMTQDINEMKVRRIGVYKYEFEPDLDDSSDIV
ncbi:hypothetical protein COBT_000015 [Conglomerata obtusa]